MFAISRVQRSIAVTSGVILKELEAVFNFDYQVDPHFDRLNDVLCGYYYRNCTLPQPYFCLTTAGPPLYEGSI